MNILLCHFARYKISCTAIHSPEEVPMESLKQQNHFWVQQILWLDLDNRSLELSHLKIQINEFSHSCRAAINMHRLNLTKQPLSFCRQTLLLMYHIYKTENGSLVLLIAMPLHKTYKIAFMLMTKTYFWISRLFICKTQNGKFQC